jgi:hypothetical protein
MKKGITILIAVMILLSALIVVTAAEDYIIETETSINGNGSFDMDLGVQTEKGFAGKKLSESFYTRFMGTDGSSNIQFNSALELYMGNSTEHENESISDIAYAQTALSTNAKHFARFSNYDVGASVCVATKEDSVMLFEGVMEDNVNSFELEGSVTGYARITEKVVDPTTRVKYLDKDVRLWGMHKFSSNHFVEKVCYPEGGDGDWLGCP